MEIQVDKDWWKDLFDEVYLLTDARSVGDDELTRREVDFLCAFLDLKQADRILDLCGGQGRHSLELSRRGYAGVALLDFSESLIRLGREKALQERLGTVFIRADARRTGLRKGSFRHVLLLGSSFGYFVEEDENRKILIEAHRLLAPGGGLLLDLPDKSYVEKAFKPVVRHTVDEDVEVVRSRVIRGDVVYACENINSRTRGCIRQNTYCTRLYSRNQIAALLAAAGFCDARFESDFMNRSEHGDYGTMTNRMIVLARKK